MTYTEAEIEAQPSLWSKTLQLAASRFDSCGSLLEGRVAFVGAGSSYYIGLAAAAYLSDAVHLEARAEPASVYRPRPGEMAVLVSRSGTTTEVLDAARAARAAGCTTMVLTCEQESPLTSLGDHSIVLDFVREGSVVQTGSATSAFLFFRALGDLMAGRGVPYPLGEEAVRALQDPVPVSGSTGHVVVLGSGWRFGLACEAALKAQEMALLWSERYVPLEYRHGPMSCADESTQVFILDPAAPHVTALEGDIRATGAGVLVARYDPLVELVRLQKLILRLALERGINPDRPRHLSRSVVLGRA